MTPFFRFPRTAHLVWLGEGQPRDDKVLLPSDAEALLAGSVVVEEKIDGANIGFSLGEGATLRVQSRGSYLDPEFSHPQFRPLWPWLKARESEMVGALGSDRILFGEWCYAVHSVAYHRLPDWFLGFDVYDRSQGEFWDSARRNSLLETIRLHAVPRIAEGHFTIQGIEKVLSTPSRVGVGAVEGLVIRREAEGFTTARAKLVRREFTQAIDEHWSRGPLRRNQLVPEAASGP